MYKEDALKYFNEQKDYLDTRVNSGIELYRKGYAMLKFVDSKGRPVSNVSFYAKQKTHDFHFGCNLFLLDELETPEKNAQYRDLFSKVFNYAVAPFYWRDLEPEKGKPRYGKDSPRVYRRPAPDLVLEYCKEHNIKVKGHCFFYDGFAPKWLPREKDLLMEENERHMQEIAQRYKDDIQDWDIVNEPLGWGYAWGVTSMYREQDYIPRCFALKEKYLPNARGFINECVGIWERYNACNSHYYLLLENLALKGVSFDGVGIQHHQFRPKNDLEFIKNHYNPKRAFEVLDTYAKLGKPIHLSEVTISSYNGDENDMQTQAILLENCYKMWFSHPSVDSIVYWNLVDGYCHNSFGDSKVDLTTGENQYGGGLLYHDLTPKPAFEVLNRLINEQWHTEGEFETLPGTNCARFKGFKGLYDLEIEYNGKRYVKEIHISDADFDDFEADSTVTVVLA